MRPLLLLVATAALLRAQSPATSIAPVYITATRVETSVPPVTSVSVLFTDSLRARGITNLADALRLVLGLSVVTSSSFGSQASLFMRGGQANYVRVLVDGVPLNEPGGAIDLGALTLDNIDRVEVVRGPASVLYGEDAAVGVVQLISRTGSRGARGALALDAGSFGQRDLSLSGAAGSDRAALSATVSDRAAQGILPFNNAYANRSGALSVRVVPDARTSASLTARWHASTYHYPTESDGTVADHNAENTSHQLALAFAGQRALTRRLTAEWTLASIEYDPRANDGPDTSADTLGYYGFYSRGTVTRRSADLRVTARAGATQSVTLGAETSRDHEKSSSLSLSQYGPDTGAFEAARQNRALYAQAIGGLGAHATYQVGARLDDNSAYGTFRTVRVGAAWQLASRWRARAALGTAFRAPSFFENFATGYVRGNAALRPERTRSRELAVERGGDGVTLSLTAYQQRFRDLIQYSSQPSSAAAPNYYNVAGANADGVELELGATLPARLRTRVTYALTRTRVTDAGFDSGDGATFVRGQPLMRRPEHSARLELARRVAARAEIAFGASYTGRASDRDYAQWPAAPVWLRAHTLLDLAVQARLSPVGARVPVSVRLRGDNLTNVAYQGVFGFRAPGRSLRAGVTIGQP
jgi:vitamin B12 transporter